jgi:hypothetical protein
MRKGAYFFMTYDVYFMPYIGWALDEILEEIENIQ